MNLIPLLSSITLFQIGPTPEPSGDESNPLYWILGFVAIAGGVGAWWMIRNRQGGDAESFPKLSRTPAPAPDIEPPPARPRPGVGTQDTSPGIKPQPRPPTARGPASTIFVSYRRHDSSDVTGRIYDRLTQHFGKQSVFKDVDSIPLGVDFRQHLSDSVSQCDVLLAVIGRQWAAGSAGRPGLDDARDFVRIEVEAALQRNIPVVPVLVQGASVPGEEELPETLRSLAYRNGIAVRPDPDFHQDMDRLIKGIEGHLKRKDNQ